MTQCVEVPRLTVRRHQGCIADKEFKLPGARHVSTEGHGSSCVLVGPVHFVPGGFLGVFPFREKEIPDPVGRGTEHTAGGLSLKVWQRA